MGSDRPPLAAGEHVIVNIIFFWYSFTLLHVLWNLCMKAIEITGLASGQLGLLTAHRWVYRPKLLYQCEQTDGLID